MILAAALAGALIMTGLVLLAAELTRKAPPPGTPPARLLSAGFTGAARRRVLLAVAAGLLMLLLTRWPVAALAAAAGVVFVPRLTSTRQARQRTAMLEGLEQWTRRLADMLTASRGLEDALEVSARTAPAAIAGPVTALARRLSARVGAEEALRAFAAEIDDPAGDRIAAALIIATGQRGGGVNGVLNALAEILARDVAARREIEADRAQHRTTVRWIIVFITGFTLFAIVNRAYSAPYGTLAGQSVLAFVCVLYAAGLGWLHKLGTIPGPGRFLDAQPERQADQPAPAAAAGQDRFVPGQASTESYSAGPYSTGSYSTGSYSTGSSSAGSYSTGSESAWPDGAWSEGAGPDGAGPDGAGPDGAGPDGAGQVSYGQVVSPAGPDGFDGQNGSGHRGGDW
jgi:Flp pilus assembly protein TadB